jgi:hypothetical protein
MSNSADVNLSRRAIINYRLVRGDSFAPPPVSFTIDSVPEDFSASSLKMQIRNDGGRQMIELTDGDGIGVSTNILQYSIAASEFDSWPAGDYKYDVQKTTSGIVVTIQSGTITLLKDITDNGS